VPEADGSPNLAHRIYLGAPFRRGLRVSSKVLGISQYMADGLVAELGIDEEQVAAMPLGVDPPAEPVSIEPREPLLLFVSALYPYKGAATAVDAFAIARPELPTGARLVIVGRDTAWQQGSSIRAQAERLGCADAVELRGRVEDAELERLYRSASAFVLPSLLEGFGLPVAEAMSRGTPVVVADATALPEVVGDAGLLVPPGDAAALAGAFTTLLCDEGRRLDLARRGVARAAELTWEASAAVLRDAVHAAASR
jgi:glycosyltransferase involved in cell wall biosynthesis